MLIRVFTPKDSTLSESDIDDFSEAYPPENAEFKWFDVDDPKEDDLKLLGKNFSLHNLTVEDISSGKQRVKVDEYEEYVFAVCKGVYVVKDQDFEYAIDEVFIILSKNYLITIHSKDSMIMNHSVEAIKNQVTSYGNRKPLGTLVLHMLFDFAVDSFYSSLTSVENWLVSFREDLIDIDSLKSKDLSQVRKLMFFIAKARKELSDFRIVLSQHRDVMSLAERGTLKFVSLDYMLAFRDVYDHTFQLIETVDSYIMRTNDVRDLYFTLRAAFTDNIIRLLTIVATIFLPLTFLTGFYGMNFTQGFYEPGSGSPYGFYSMVAIMLSLIAVLLIVFKKKGWI